MTTSSTPPPNRGAGGSSGGVGGAWDFLPGGGSFAVGGSQSPLSSGQLFGAGGGGGGGDAASSVGVGASDLDDDDVGGGGGGSGDAWDRRGERGAREKAHRRARAELKRFTAARKFPTNVGVVQVHSLGRVRPEAGFYSLGRLAPVGFRASRTERAPADQALVHCVMEVLEVPDPVAALSPVDGDKTGSATRSVPSTTASGDGAAAIATAKDGGAAPAPAPAPTPAGSSPNAAGHGDGVGGAVEGGAGEGGGGKDGRKSRAVFRVTLSGLRGERGTFEDVSAGRAWRAALRSIGAKVGKAVAATSGLVLLLMRPGCRCRCKW